jgi:hypothetical protein
MEADHVESRRGDQGSELAEKIERLEDHTGGAIAPGSLEAEDHATIGPLLDAASRQRRPQDVSAQSLQALEITGRHGLLCMEVEG